MADTSFHDSSRPGSDVGEDGPGDLPPAVGPVIEAETPERTEEWDHDPDPGDLLWRVWNELFTRHPDWAPRGLVLAKLKHVPGSTPIRSISTVLYPLSSNG